MADFSPLVSTVDPVTALRISDAISAAGGKFLEAPVSGSKGPAEEGQLVFLGAGDKELFESIQHPLQAISSYLLRLSAIIHAGPFMPFGPEPSSRCFCCCCRSWEKRHSSWEKLATERK